jgi:hypothetical protein
MKKIMLKLIFISILYSCGQPKETPSVKSSLGDSSLQVSDTLGSKGQLYARELFKVPVTKFFREGSIRKLPYGESTLKYLIPITLFVDTDYVYIPDRSRSRIAAYDFSGNYVREYKLKIEDPLLHKIVVGSEGDIYALDVNKGLFVFDSNLNNTYRDEKTIDFHVDVSRENLYLENMLGEERAILDTKKTLKEPLKIDYYSIYIQNDTLRGIGQIDDLTLSITTKVLPDDGKTLNTINWKISCDYCVILPQFIAKKIVLSSRDQPRVDQICFIQNQDIKTYPITYPNEAKPFRSDESANYSYTGYFYFFDKGSKALFSICTDTEYIKVYKTDLPEVLE